MPTSPTKLQRWLDVIAYLVGRRLPVSADELMRAIPAYAQRWQSENPTDQQTARRTFERDKDELRRLGIPIRTMKYSIDWGRTEEEGYVIERRDFYLPYLTLVQQASGETRSRTGSPHRPASVEVLETDAPLALEALRRVVGVPGFPLMAEARSAFRKLAFDLDPDAFMRSPAVLFAEPPGAAELRSRLRVLSDALLARKHVRFRYHGIQRNIETSREVDGYGLLLQQGQWYFIGFDHERQDRRVFRIGRMHDVVANTMSPNQCDYEIPPEFRLADHVGRQAWELGEPDEEPVIARVLFRFPLSLWAERNEHGTLLERLPDGSALRTFEVHQVGPFLRWLLGHRGEAELLEPPALVAELRALAEAVASAHEESRDGS